MSTPSLTFCYHGRDSKGVKLFGGMLHAENWEQAAERATVGHGVSLTTFAGEWVDKQGRKVSLYLSVCPDQTKRGAAEIATLRKARDEERRKEQERLDALDDVLEREIDAAGGTEAALVKLRA